MEQSYQVGTGNNQIILNVTISTVGVAYTEFSTMKNLQNLGISGHSKQRSGGKIDNITLGSSDELKGVTVTIRIHIELSHLTRDQRESAVELFLHDNTPVTFQFSGGQDGIKQFTYNKEMDLLVVPNKKDIFITSQIELI